MFAAILMLCGTLQTVAQTIVKDKEDGVPVAYATVFNSDGEYIGQTDIDGSLPALGNTQAVSISHVAYEPLTIQTTQLPAELLMTPATFTLSETVVVPKEVYCIRLTGYRRKVLIPVLKKDRDSELLTYEECKGECYLLVDKNKGEWYDIVERNSLTGQMKQGGGSHNAPVDSKVPHIEKLVQDGHVELQQADGYQQVVGKRKAVKQLKSNIGMVIGAVKPDAKAGVITTSYDAIYPDSMLHYNSLLLKMKIYEAKYSEVYRKPADSDEMKIANLLGQNSVGHMWISLFGMKMEARMLSDFYVEDVDYLTKDEYKAAMKEVKARRKEPIPMTSEQLDAYAESLHVKPLPASVQQNLMETQQAGEAWKAVGNKTE